MELFRNDFVERQWHAMQLFLQRISTTSSSIVPSATAGGTSLQDSLPPPFTAIDEHQLMAMAPAATDAAVDSEIDVAKELSQLHIYLQDSWTNQVQKKEKNINNYKINSFI
jgi:hypothetical protein